MHQPDYRDYASGEFLQSWTYLHALKDYTDMAWHLERCPGAKAVVNLVPILLEQIEDYAEQCRSASPRDRLLRALHSGQGYALEARKFLVDSCFRGNHATMLEPFPAYRRLRELAHAAESEAEAGLLHLSDQYFADLVTWYHLAWTGESLRREQLLVRRLMEQGAGFSLADRRELFQLIGASLGDLIGRYRRLAEAGRVELSTTPFCHPIAPLLIDFACARESSPEAPLPQAAAYPGGEARARWHIRAALEGHARRFGAPPAGVWPAEGGVSTRAVELFADAGVRWTASGEGVLHHSLVAARPGEPLPAKSKYLYRSYTMRYGDASIRCFFRDDTLSDRIGFEYSKWVGSDAAIDFVKHLEDLRAATPADTSPIVSVILDGENAWEFYPYNGYYFLSELYQRLASHPTIRLTTYSEYLALAGEAPPASLSRLIAGSWVYGNFSTWIGGPEKNRAWDLLCQAKAAYDRALAGGIEPRRLAQLERQLASCEASDWFWWLGDYNPSQSVASFDRQYRHNLRNLYRLLELTPPVELDHPLSVGGGQPESGGAMRRAS